MWSDPLQQKRALDTIRTSWPTCAPASRSIARLTPNSRVGGTCAAARA
jgi:hypothetical protein